jgi:hypothetical protein
MRFFKYKVDFVIDFFLFLVVFLLWRSLLVDLNVISNLKLVSHEEILNRPEYLANEIVAQTSNERWSNRLESLGQPTVIIQKVFITR